MSSILRAATTGGALKAGFVGLAGSGKTMTAVELAIAVRAHFKHPGPIAMADTEKGSDYWQARVKKRTGLDLLVVKSKRFDDLVAAHAEAESSGVSVFIADSMTAFWKELCDAHLLALQRQAEERAVRFRREPRIPQRLELKHLDPIKRRWQIEWVDRFVNSPMHTIVCGRLGYEYDFDENDDGQKELVKTGVKMKAEGEFGYEPSLLVQMYQEQDLRRGRMTAHARVLKDRFGILTGEVIEQPKGRDFRKHYASLDPAQHDQVITTPSAAKLHENGADDWALERQQREINAEKIRAAFALAGIDGQSAAEKKKRAEEMQRFWGTTSQTELAEKIQSDRQLQGLAAFERAHALCREDDVPDFDVDMDGRDD